jgi:hypothetical protein
MLYFTAKRGDLLMVPLGSGMGGDVAIGEFTTDPGKLDLVQVGTPDEGFKTWGRRMEWRVRSRKTRFSIELVNSIHSSNAMHLLPNSSREEIYLAAYQSFTFKGLYVATFPTGKEHFTTTDQATVGIWFNGLAVIHDRIAANRPINDNDDFYALGLEPSSADFDLQRNSPISAIFRTIGPLAFTALATYPLAVEGAPLTDLNTVTVSAKTVGSAVDHCKVIIPADLADVARGFGHGRWATQCKLGERVQKHTTLDSRSRLKPRPKGTK